MSRVSEQNWAPGPPEPRLAEDEVHVWRADLNRAGDELLELLCERERARAAHMVSERDRLLWSRSRGVLRALLGRYLRVDGRTIGFVEGEHGKPALEVSDPTSSTRPTLRFNISHSGALALYAFAPTAAVGVDVELTHGSHDEVALARRMLGPAQAQRLAQLDPETRRSEFLRAWTRHEAELKCLGVGIGEAGRALDRGQRPWIEQLEIGTDGAAALAVSERPRGLRCWDWPAGDEASCG